MPVQSKALPCDAVFAVACVSPKGALAVLYFARSVGYSVPLKLVDFDVGPIDGGTWAGVDDRLSALSATHRARQGVMVLWVESESLLMAALGAGVDAMLIPPVITTKAAWQELGIAAMVQVRSGNVKVADEVFDRRDELADTTPFGALKLEGGERGDDATVPAMLYGIAIGLDEATAALAARAAV